MGNKLFSLLSLLVVTVSVSDHSLRLTGWLVGTRRVGTQLDDVASKFAEVHHRSYMLGICEKTYMQ